MSDSATPWIIVHLAPLSMEYSRQEYWSRLPFPAPGDLPQPGIEPHLFHLLHWQANSLPLQKPIIVLLVTCCKHVLTVYDFSLFSKHLFIFFFFLLLFNSFIRIIFGLVTEKPPWHSSSSFGISVACSLLT